MALEGTVVVVDDEPDIVEAIAALLGYAFPGLRILATASPHEALRHARDGVDLLVTDYRMPQMDGLELARHAQEADDRLPIVMVTAFRERNVRDQAESMGIDVVHKPIEPA